MPKQNRGYKKGNPHRDARLFVIVAEGEREDKYFAWFNEKNQRIKVKIIPREQNKSAPNHFLERIDKFITNGWWASEENDTLWLVLDVDRWPRTEINNLIEECSKKTNWNIAISNPCFEVWVLFHLKQRVEKGVGGCQKLKEIVNEALEGGFHPDKLCPLIDEATRNSRMTDQDPESDYPELITTKLYKLSEKMLEMLGSNWKN